MIAEIIDLPSTLSERIGKWFSQGPVSGAQAQASPETELVARIAAGDSAALDAAYRAHHQVLRAFAQRLLGEPSAAEDLVHDVFVALPRAARNFRGESSLSTFLVGIGVKLSRRHIRSAGRRRAMLERLSQASQVASSVSEDEAERSARARALSRALDALPVAMRTAFVLHEVEERPAAEVALILTIPEATVRTRCFHARKKLRELLAEVSP